MLAQRFSRLRESPVRYAAMDPAHLQAIENYLRINTRAHGLPQLHQQSQRHLAPLYQEHPQIAPHFGGILQGGHDALMEYLDLLNDHLGINRDNIPPNAFYGEASDIERLAARLYAMSDAAGNGRQAESSPMGVGGGNIHTMYSQAALEHPSTQDVISGTLRNPLNLRNVVDDIHRRLVYHHGYTSPLVDQSHLLGQQLTRDDPPQVSGLLAGYDLANSPEVLANHPQMREHRDTFGAALRQHLIPHLAENFG